MLILSALSGDDESDIQCLNVHTRISIAERLKCMRICKRMFGCGLNYPDTSSVSAVV